METTKDRKKPRYTQDFSADLKSRDEDSAFAALGGESQKAGAALGGESQKAGAALGGESQKAGAALGGESQKAGAALGGESQKAGAALGGESQKAGAAAVRVIDPGSSDHSEQQWEHSLRPKSFDEFPGQENVKEKIKVFVEAARHRQEPLDHVLLSGPPGLGKTTLATIIANTMGVEIKTTSGPALDKKGDLAAILTSLKANSILFIDEIHRLSTVVEEYLYSAMEDYYIDIVTGDGLGARTMKFSLSPFTLVGATTRAGLLNAPFRDRFGIVERLSFYDKTTLASIITRSSGLLKTAITPEGAMEVAKRSRGTPRVANRLLKRVRDYAQVKSNGTIDEKLAAYALDQLEVDHLGLDEMDRKILVLIGEKFAGGPVGIETLSAALSEEKDTLEEVYEPFLIQEGLIQKTPRGRVITELAKRHLQTQTVTVRAE